MDRRGFLLISLAAVLDVPVVVVFGTDAYVHVQGEVRRPGAVKHTSGSFWQDVCLHPAAQQRLLIATGPLYFGLTCRTRSGTRAITSCSSSRTGTGGR